VNKFLPAALSRIPLFWRFQVAGWATLIVATFPLKCVVLAAPQDALIVFLYPEGLGFLTTWGMREIYRRCYRANTTIDFLSLLILGVSLLGASIQAFLAMKFHALFAFEAEQIFKNLAIFGLIYFRVVLCLAWSFLYFGIKLWREKNERELRMVQIESEKHRAELQMLRAQMNPHFLFNALTMIRAAIGKSDINLKAIIQSLADYLRYALECRDDDLVPIGKEFEALSDYLDVEKARFREELQIECRLDEEINATLVPGIMLQPLVENAVKYGRASSPMPLRVRMLVSRTRQEMLRIEVSNTGTWQEPLPFKTSGGIGLKNLRKRLELLYPGKHRFEIVSDEGWVKVSVEIPLST
jgi:signal transduction histidine kinase